MNNKREKAGNNKADILAVMKKKGKWSRSKETDRNPDIHVNVPNIVMYFIHTHK